MNKLDKIEGESKNALRNIFLVKQTSFVGLVVFEIMTISQICLKWLDELNLHL